MIDVMTDPTQRFFRNMFARVPVSCPHGGCEWNGQQGARGAHEETCPQAEGKWCSHCDVSMKRSEKNGHEEGCPKRPVLCPGCRKNHPHDESAQHEVAARACEVGELKAKLKAKVQKLEVGLGVEHL